MKWKRVLFDPSFWILLAANIFLVYNYERNPKIFTTLIWLYWSQNVLYGIFNFLALATSKKVDAKGYREPGGPVKSDIKIASDAAWGFLFMFGFFHFVYLIFVAIMASSGPFQWGFYKTYLLAFFVLQLINFIQVKIQNREIPLSVTKMATMPYLRVIPMHLCILIPAFFHWSGLTVFLVLKVVVDILTYLITTSYYHKGRPVPEVAVMNIDSTISFK